MHVRDVANANVLALTAPLEADAVVNIATGCPHTVFDMADALAQAFGPGAPEPVVTGAWRAGDVRHVCASPALAEQILGFRARIRFTEGMAEFATSRLRA